VRGIFASIFGYFLSPFGLFLLSTLDSSMLMFLPLAVDTATIILAARHSETAFAYPALATAGSLIGAAATFWIGRRAGEHGLERFVSSRRLEYVKARIRKRGAVALAVPALLPPPFPLTPFILACGALDVSRVRFFVTLGLFRILRFGIEALLAVHYGPRILSWMKSTVFETIVGTLAVVAVIGTAVGGWALIRQSRRASAGEPRTAA
jgi:membrane protein YqaA with SNARE-associated domain